MSDRDPINEWWDDVPANEKPALKTLGALVLLCLLAGSITAIYTHLS